MVVQVCEYTEDHCMVYFTMVKSMVCELNLNTSVSIRVNIIGNKKSKEHFYILKDWNWWWSTESRVLVCVLYTYKVRNWLYTSRKRRRKMYINVLYRVYEDVIEGQQGLHSFWKHKNSSQNCLPGCYSHLVALGNVNSPIHPSYTYIWPSRQPWRKWEDMQGHIMTVIGPFHHKKKLNSHFMTAFV